LANNRQLKNNNYIYYRAYNTDTHKFKFVVKFKAASVTYNYNYYYSLRQFR